MPSPPSIVVAKSVRISRLMNSGVHITGDGPIEDGCGGAMHDE